MKIVFTGGHFSPAYAIIQELKSKNEILVIGRKYAFEGDRNETLEYKLCQQLAIPFINLNAGRFQRFITKNTVPSLIRFPKGVYEAIRILKLEKPNVVVTFGGYVALPVALAAFFLKIPIVLHEQTQKAGLSSKLIGRFAQVICISSESSRKYFKNKKIVVTGNPIRKEIINPSNEISFPKVRPILYITGGSTGAHIINEVLYEILPKLLEEFCVVHQTGNSKLHNDFSKMKLLYDSLKFELKVNYIVKQFFTPDEVGWLFHNSAIVVSRAGANTVAELMATGAISLLIPFPYGQIDEQLNNAKLLKKSGIGEYMEQNYLTPETLVARIHDMMENRVKYEKNAEILKNNFKNDASEKIIEQINIYGRREESFKDR